MNRENKKFNVKAMGMVTAITVQSIVPVVPSQLFRVSAYEQLEAEYGVEEYVGEVVEEDVIEKAADAQEAITEETVEVDELSESATEVEFVQETSSDEVPTVYYEKQSENSEVKALSYEFDSISENLEEQLIINVASLSVNKTEASVGDAVKISVQIDGANENTQVWVIFRTSQALNYEIRLDFNELTGFFEGGITVSEYTDYGLWILESIYAHNYYRGSIQNSVEITTESYELSAGNFMVLGSWYSQFHQSFGYLKNSVSSWERWLTNATFDFAATDIELFQKFEVSYRTAQNIIENIILLEDGSVEMPVFSSDEEFRDFIQKMQVTTNVLNDLVLLLPRSKGVLYRTEISPTLGHDIIKSQDWHIAFQPGPWGIDRFGNVMEEEKFTNQGGGSENNLVTHFTLIGYDILHNINATNSISIQIVSDGEKIVEVGVQVRTELPGGRYVDEVIITRTEDVEIPKVGLGAIGDVFPDSELAESIVQKLQEIGVDITDASSFITQEELDLITQGNFFGAISSLEGLQYLRNLETLLIYGGSTEGETFVFSPLTSLEPLASLNQLSSLTVLNTNISDITALSGLASLTHLHLQQNQIQDVSPLSELTNLETLFLSLNQIEDISPLANLTNLSSLMLGGLRAGGLPDATWREIWVYDNLIQDLSPLSNLSNLETLWLANNQISDISALRNLTNLSELDLSGNRISDLRPLENLNLDYWFANGQNIVLESVELGTAQEINIFMPDGSVPRLKSDSEFEFDAETSQLTWLNAGNNVLSWEANESAPFVNHSFSGVISQMVTEEVSQPEITTIITALQNLVNEIQALFTTNALNPTDYTEESWTRFLSALYHAETILSRYLEANPQPQAFLAVFSLLTDDLAPTLEEVQQAYAELREAFEGLVVVEMEPTPEPTPEPKPEPQPEPTPEPEPQPEPNPETTQPPATRPETPNRPSAPNRPTPQRPTAPSGNRRPERDRLPSTGGEVIAAAPLAGVGLLGLATVLKKFKRK